MDRTSEQQNSTVNKVQSVKVSSSSNTSSREYFASLFSGRLNRRNYFVGVLIPNIIYTIACALLIIITINSGFYANSRFGANLVLITYIYTVLLIIYIIPLMVRRLHDVNQTGWLWLLTLIPFVNTLLGIYLLFFPGTEGENKYGTEPLPRINIKQDILRL